MNANKRSWLSGWRLVFLIYITALVASHIWESFNPAIHPLDKKQQTVLVKAVAGDSLLPDKKVTIAYRDEYLGDRKNPQVILLLHGSPIAVPMFKNFIPELSTTFRVIALDMPGYDASTRNVPSYSIRSYSIYAKQLLGSLSINSAHVVGYSLGGGVAINLAHFYPSKVKSMDLLSSIGVQELELLGSYQLNHAIHGIQLGLLWLLQEAVPHFGYLTNFPLNVPYARSFYDSDQRPLREYLKYYEKPMLIQQGKGDELVPLAAAKEHRRIVPQSTLITYDGGHGIVRSSPKLVAEDLIAFVKSVESSNALFYQQAKPERLQAAKKPFEDIDFEKFKGLTLIIIMMIIVMGTLVSEDLTCIGAGLMAARGLIGFWPAVIACFAGIFLGDILLYLAGRWFGKPAVRRAPLKWFLTEKDLKKSEEWFKAKGPAIIIASRFLPGSRMPTYFSAGAVGAGFWMFTFYFLIACIVWTPLLVGLSMLIGNELLVYFAAYSEYALFLFILGILFLVFVAKVIIPAFSYRGRRLLLSRWRRLTNWEFWPPHILYFPVCIYIAFLWVNFKQLTVFTAANPGIEHGGFIGESKKQILDAFKNSDCVAAYQFLSQDMTKERARQKVSEFMEQNELDFPVVLKPDAGQRGTGVKMIKNAEALKQAIESVDYDSLIQEYIPGEEFGVFYYRYPGDEAGKILSITTKKMLTLTGDGQRTIEKLILDDDRAVCMAKTHLDYHADHLYQIPGKGEEIPLVEFGTHARGAVFGDGSDLITPQLTAAMNKISLQVEGFYFGRFDIRTPSEKSLKEGKELHIIEVNGVTSEDTSIYDEQNSFWDAQKKLMKQWRIAFEIGAENVQAGASYSSVGALVKEMTRYEAK